MVDRTDDRDAVQYFINLCNYWGHYWGRIKLDISHSLYDNWGQIKFDISHTPSELFTVV